MNRQFTRSDDYLSLVIPRLDLIYSEKFSILDESIFHLGSRYKNSVKVLDYLKKNNDWKFLDLENFKEFFGEDEYWNIFLNLSYHGIKTLMPIIIKFTYQSYQSSDFMIEICEKIFSNLIVDLRIHDTDVSVEQTFNSDEILLILELMVFYDLDPTHRYGGQFSACRSELTRFLGRIYL